MAKAAEAGQNITSNKDIGIGTDGNIVNLDLWNYKAEEDEISIYAIGSGESAYKGKIINGKIEETVPQHVVIADNPNKILDVKYLSIGEKGGGTSWNDKNTMYGTGGSGFIASPDLVSIELPNTITYIGEYAFGCDSVACSSLTRIVVPNSVREINPYAFSHNGAYYISTEIIIDNSKGAISGAPWGAPYKTKVTYLR